MCLIHLSGLLLYEDPLFDLKSGGASDPLQFSSFTKVSSLSF